MLHTIYKWTREYMLVHRTTGYVEYNPNKPTIVSYIPQDWFEGKTENGGFRFWNIVNARANVSVDDNGAISFSNILPNGIERTYETFEPIDISLLDDGTHSFALEVAHKNRELHHEKHNGHTIIWIEMDDIAPPHDHITASFDLDDMKWVDIDRTVF